MERIFIESLTRFDMNLFYKEDGFILYFNIGNINFFRGKEIIVKKNQNQLKKN